MDLSLISNFSKNSFKDPLFLDAKYNVDFIHFLFENDFKAIFPELFLSISILFLLLYGVILSTSKIDKEYPILLFNTSILSLLSLAFTFFLLFSNPLKTGFLFYNSLLIDKFTFFLKGLLLIACFCSISIGLNYFKKSKINNFEYVILILISTCSMLFLVSSADFISSYLALELQSLAFYVIAASKRHSEFSTEAGLKYFLLGGFSSGVLLLGCSLIYGFTGTTNFVYLNSLFTVIAPGYEDSSVLLYSLRGCELGILFILVGFLFKVTAVPFHMYAPDVYEGSPMYVTAFFSIVPKISIFGILIRILNETFFNFTYPWEKTLIFCSIASMVLGSFAALAQTRIKRLLAFSSISHVGYILIGIACGTLEGVEGVLLYLLIYIIMTINVFAILLSSVKRTSDISESTKNSKYITDLAFLGRTNPVLGITLSTTLFSMAGIPPLAGFYSKAYLFFAGMSSSLYLLSFIGVLCSVVSCFFYIRVIKIIYFETPKEYLTFDKMSKANSYITGITFLLILFFIFFPSFFYNLTYNAALTISF